MKKIGTVLALALVLMSCSNDDDKTKEEFFNLKVGNQWVYKKYNVNTEGLESYSGQTDTVKVVGTETIDGKEFYKLTHTGDFFDEELLRVDEAGHLISSSGFVVHPGTDKEFTESRVVLDDNGVINYALKDIVSVTVEDKNYEVYPFSGYYTPYPGEPGTEGVGVVESYSKGIGFVIRHYKYLAGTSYFEYRLVSYDLK